MARISRATRNQDWEDLTLWRDFHSRDLSIETEYMRALAELRARAGISYQEISRQWRKAIQDLLGAEPPLSTSRIHDLFRQQRLPRTREQLERILTVLITANKVRPQDSTTHAVLLQRGLELMQARGHR